MERILEELQADSQNTSFAHQYPSRDSNIFTPPNPPFHRASVSTTYSAQSAATEASLISVPGQSPGTYGLQYIAKDGDDQSFIPPFVHPVASAGASIPGTPGTPRTSIPATPPEPPSLATTHIEDLEERALQMAMEEGKSLPLIFNEALTRHSPKHLSNSTPPLGRKRSSLSNRIHHPPRRCRHRRPR